LFKRRQQETKDINEHKKPHVMKAKMIITAAAIIFSITATMANPNETTLTFWSSLGQKLIQPIMPEEMAVPVPFKVANEVETIRTENTYRVFDLSQLTKPEVEEELPFDLQEVYKTAKK
jgi:hypothetical protein